MTNKTFAEVYREVGSQLILEEKNRQSISQLIKHAQDKGWKKISVSGSRELCKGAWFEARMAGLEVSGYIPTPKDNQQLDLMKQQRAKSDVKRLTGEDIARDYSLRVIPKVQQDYDELRKKRLKIGLHTTELDRTYKLNVPSGTAKELDEQFFQAKRVLVKSMEDRDFFQRVGRRSVTAEYGFQDGIAKYTISSTERDILKRQIQSSSLSRGRMP